MIGLSGPRTALPLRLSAAAVAHAIPIASPRALIQFIFSPPARQSDAPRSPLAIAAAPPG